MPAWIFQATWPARIVDSTRCLSGMNILSIQSAVAYGHVGNSSAVFPLQRLGAEVWPINTVQFSNHPGYGAHTGSVTPPETIRALIEGIEARGVLPSCAALLTGYIGDPRTGQAVLHAATRLRAANPAALWCCDPVIGDDGPGIYVRPGIEPFFRDQAVPQADILTPNQFELALITGSECASEAGLRHAIAALQSRMRATGPRIVLVTSVRTQATPAGALDMFAASSSLHRVRTPLLPISVNGAGDAIAAVFLFHILRSADAAHALGMAASALYGVLSATLAAGSRELLTVAAQAEFVNPSRYFAAEAA
jgi:pyridoxine kinase